MAEEKKMQQAVLVQGSAFNLSTIKLTHRDRFAVFIVYLILLYLCLMITAGHCKGIGKGH